MAFGDLLNPSSRAPERPTPLFLITCSHTQPAFLPRGAPKGPRVYGNGKVPHLTLGRLKDGLLTFRKMDKNCNRAATYCYTFDASPGAAIHDDRLPETLAFTKYLTHQVRKKEAAVARILTRLDRAKKGNLGVWNNASNGVLENVIDYGSGDRIYFAKVDETHNQLLIGGEKATLDSESKGAHRLAKQHGKPKADQEIRYPIIAHQPLLVNANR